MHKLGTLINASRELSSSVTSHPSSSHSTNPEASPPNTPPRNSTPPFRPQDYGSLYSDSRQPHHLNHPQYTLDFARIGADGDSLPRLADRFVKGWVHRRPAFQRSGRTAPKKEDSVAHGTGLEDSAVLTSMGRGPEGSERAAVVGNELIRIIAFKSPPSLPPLPPPTHAIPPAFSLYNTSAHPPPTPPSTPNTTAFRPDTPRAGSGGRKTSSGNGKAGSRGRKNGHDFDGGDPVKLGRGPGGVEVEEVGTLKGLRDATGGSGVMETRWGTGTLSNKIFVSSRKGSIFVWDVNQPGKIQNNIIVDNTRRPITAMRLAPAGFDTGEMLVTAGHDMIVRVFDLRSSRTTPHTLHTLTSNSLINCLAICPTNSHQVVLGLDNGSLGWIDWRRGNRLANRKFSAHADAVMSVDWKESLDERGEGRAAGGWIASGGLDKKVHIWNNSSPSKTLDRTLRTLHPISKVSWRPGHDTEIAVSPYSSKSAPNTLSEAIESDSQIQIWDVRRGYVAKYLLEGGEGHVAEIAWNDHGSLWAAYKNGLVAQHDIRLHSRPLDDVPVSTVCWDPSGHLAFALDQWKDGEMPFDDVKAEVTPHLSGLGKVAKSIHDDPFEPKQVLAVYKVPGFERDTFASLARRYKVEGASPERLCEINARVALRHGLEREWLVWLQLLSIIADVRLITSQIDVPFSTKSKPIPDFDQVPSLNLPPPTVQKSPRGRDVPLPSESRLFPRPRPRSTSQSPLSQAFLPERSSSSGHPRKTSAARSRLRQSRIRSADTVDLDVEPGSPQNATTPVPLEYRNTTGISLNLGTSFGISSDSSITTTDESDIEDSSSSSADNAPTPTTTHHTTRLSFTSNGERPNFVQSFYQPSSSLPSSRRLSPASHVPRPVVSRPAVPPVSPAPDSDSSSGDDDDDFAPGPYGEVYGLTSTHSAASTAVVPKDRDLPASSRPSPTVAGRSTHLNTHSDPSSRQSPRYSPTSKGAASERKPSAGSPRVGQHPPSRKRTDEDNQEAGPWELNKGVRDERAIWESFLRAHGLKLGMVHEWITFYLGEGDCQMASTLFFVARSVIDLSLVQAERYVTAYVDLLMSLELYSAAATIRKYGQIASLETVSQVNTTTHLSCPIHLTHETAFAGEETASAAIGRGTCEKTEKAAIVCCICDLPVTSGLLQGCQTCCHGGHASCLSAYFSLTPSTALNPFNSYQAYQDSSSATSDHSHQSQSVIAEPNHSPAPRHREPQGGQSGVNTNRFSGEFGAEVRWKDGATGSEGLGEMGGGQTGVWGQVCPAGCGHLCAVSNYVSSVEDPRRARSTIGDRQRLPGPCC